MAKVDVYSKGHCPFCKRAKDLLERKGIAFTEFEITTAAQQDEMAVKASGRRSVPQIFINDKGIGGCDDLHALDASGELDKLVNG